MKKISENQRKQNLLKVKSCYFASYTAYDENGSARTSGWTSFEHIKNCITPSSVTNLSNNIKNSDEKLKDFIIVINSIQKTK
ncbi:MAG: hypothetical protein ACRDAG_01130 [Cetobacterium somerae]|uniref:hypothetical protein n=1 Tax=Cetobacterium somerae TaxID=188913 RepID=UPI003F2F7A4F